MSVLYYLSVPYTPGVIDTKGNGAILRKYENMKTICAINLTEFF